MSNEPTDRSRRVFAGVLVLADLGAVVVGFVRGQKSPKKAGINYLLGGSDTPGNTAMWAAYAVAALCLLGALIAWLSTGARQAVHSAPRPAPGWYEDPDDPQGLRYWSGLAWSEKVASKGQEAP